MNPSSAKILQYIAGHEAIEDVPIDELQKQVEEHPYFAVSQFLLAKKLFNLGDDSFLAQAQKTALYFRDPKWLHYKLQEQNIGLAGTPTEEQPHSQLIENADKKHLYAAPFETSTLVSQNGSDLLDQATADLTSASDTSSNTVETAEQIETANAQTANTTNLPEQSQQANGEQTLPGNVPVTELESTADNTQTNDLVEVAEHWQSNATNTDNISENEETVGFADKHDTAEEAANTAADGTPHNNQNNHTPFSLKQAMVESEPFDEHELMFQNIKAMLDATSEEADADVENSTIPIDPYFTIDYFASQGIKLELEQNPNDQLGKQVKKFTQWLKHMKKLGPEDAAEAVSRTEHDSDVEQFADRSNTAREVVTEAMALVLEKQGKKEKAIELYNKLSFMNTDKSAYFAAKIQNLKGS